MRLNLKFNPSGPASVALALVLGGVAALTPSVASASADPTVSFPGSSASNPVSPDLVALERFEVVGTRPHAIDTSVLKVPARILETPRSLTVLDSSRIREQDFQSAADLLFWVPGINSNGDSYHFYARGFKMLPGDWKIDGFQGRVIGGSYAPNLFGVEAVSVLKGPAGLLYGATSSPGGQISLTMKRPSEVASRTLDTRVRTFLGGESSFGEAVSYEVEFDATGPVTRDARLLYRFLSSNEHARLKPATPDENQFYRLSFTYKLDPAGRYQFTPMVEWSREDRAIRGATISPSSSRTTADGRTDYSLADATPRDVNLAAGTRDDENLTFGFDLNGRLTDRWFANLTVRRHTRDYASDAWNAQTATLRQTDPADPRSWTVLRRQTRARSEFENTSLDANTTYEFAPHAAVKSRLLAGLNARWQDSQAYTSTTGADQSAINTFTGAAATPLVADANPLLPRGALTRTYAWNGYVQSQTTFLERLTFTLSGGLTGDEVETIAATGTSSGKVARDSAVTPNAGLVYLLTPKIAAYSSYSTSYSLPSTTAEDAAGRLGTFNPTEGESLELGLKAEFWGDLLAASASVFRTELNNVLVQSEANELNPNGTRFYRQLDTGRRSEGLEVEFTVSPVRGWDTTFGYAYIDAFNRNLDGSAGARAEMTPKHAFSVYTRYAFRRGPLAGLSTRLGFIAQTDRVGGAAATATAPDPLRLAAFHRVDLGVAYRLRTWNFALNLENLTNENYLIGGSTGLNLDRANPRSAALRISRFW